MALPNQYKFSGGGANPYAPSSSTNLGMNNTGGNWTPGEATGSTVPTASPEAMRAYRAGNGMPAEDIYNPKSGANNEVASNYKNLFNRSGSQIDQQGQDYWNKSGLTGSALTGATATPANPKTICRSSKTSLPAMATSCPPSSPCSPARAT